MSRLAFLTHAAETADLGLRFATTDMHARPSTFAPRSAQHQNVIGIYQIDIDAKMKQIMTSATSLSHDIAQNVLDKGFRDAYAAWFEDWNAYYKLTQQLGNKLFSNPFRTDEIDAQVESYRDNLLGWYRDYRTQVGHDGRTVVPPPKGQPPIAPPPRQNKEESKGAGLPWYFWVLGGVALVGVSYIVYRKVQEGRAKVAYVHKQAPGLLEKWLGPAGKPAYEYSQAGRDAIAPRAGDRGRDPNFMLVESDVLRARRERDAAQARDPRNGDRSPFQLSNYARDPSAMSAVHRGFPIASDQDEMLFEEQPRTLPRPQPVVRDAPDRFAHFDRDYDDYDEDY